jgi:cytochrome c556
LVYRFPAGYGLIALGALPEFSQEHRMFRRSSIAFAILLFGVAAVAAEDDPIAARKALMKANGDQAKIAGDMAKGAVPFDLDAAHKIFTTFENAAAKMPGLFPDDSKTGGKTEADPKIWDNMADFKARFQKLGEDAKAADASVKDLDSFKAAIGNIGKNDCGGCHQNYRIKKS